MLTGSVRPSRVSDGWLLSNDDLPSSCPMRQSLTLALSATRRSLSVVHDVPLWIDGEAVLSSRTFDIRHPLSNETVSRVAACDDTNLYASSQILGSIILFETD